MYTFDESEYCSQLCWSNPIQYFFSIQKHKAVVDFSQS